MLIGVLSDSHDHIPHTKEAVTVFKRQSVDVVLHAGDFCSPFMVPLFEGLTLKGVFGNNDGDQYLLMKKFATIKGEVLGTFAKIQFDGLSIALYHGTDAPVTQALIDSGNFDVVISGHTHERRNEKVGATLALNPGTAHGFGREASIALLDTDTLEVNFHLLS